MQNRSDQLLLLAFPVALAILTLCFAVPRLAASFHLLPSQETMRALGKGQPVLDASLQGAIGARQMALTWLAAPRPRAELGGVRLYQASKAGYGTAEGKKFLEASIAAERQSLSLSPVQPYAWVQLLQARLAHEGPSPALSPLFIMAVRAAPVEPRLLMRRLAIGLSFWTFLDAEATARLQEQAFIAAHYFPTQLAMMTKKRYALKLVRDALAKDPALRSRFDRIYISL